MKKKRILIAVGAVVCILAALFVASGFAVRTDMGLMEYAVSEDGASMTIRADVMSSMGYARACKATPDGEKLYLTFFAAFGGFNSAIGARNAFEIPLSPSCAEIYIRRADGYALALRRDSATGLWQRP